MPAYFRVECNLNMNCIEVFLQIFQKLRPSDGKMYRKEIFPNVDFSDLDNTFQGHQN